MDELIAFVRQQLDDDERAMRRVPDDYRLYACDDGHVEQPIGQWADGDDRLPNHHNSWSLVYDRAERLAEIDAKRRILAHIGMVVISPGREALPAEYVEQMELFLRWLAQPYAGRDGWREEWHVSAPA